MRHKNKKYHLDGKKNPKKMTFRNLVTSFIMYDRVKTTLARGKALQRKVDDLIQIAKKDDKVVAIRKLNAYLLDDKASRKLIEVLKDKYKERESGYTRMVKEGFRKGDGALTVSVELI